MAILKFAGVTKVFGSGAGEYRVLDNVDFELEPEEVVAVMGPSGSGKTTLLTIGGALQHPTSGVVEIEGQEIQNLSQTELSAVRRRKVGFIFQNLNLLEALSAKENVEYALKLAGYKSRWMRERARNLLSIMDLQHRQDVLPKSLSGGERQRVGVARALANDGRLILADEPTASLDQTRATDLLLLLRGIARDLGRGILLVTHDMRAHDQADRIFWLEGGALRPIRHGDAHLLPHAATAEAIAPVPLDGDRAAAVPERRPTEP